MASKECTPTDEYAKKKKNRRNRCVAYGCGNTSNNEISVHRFPTDLERRQTWEKFVMHRRADFKKATANSVLCSFHFTLDSYEDWMHSQNGIAIGNNRKRIMKKNCGSNNSFPCDFVPETDLSLLRPVRLGVGANACSFKNVKTIRNTY